MGLYERNFSDNFAKIFGRNAVVGTSLEEVWSFDTAQNPALQFPFEHTLDITSPNVLDTDTWAAKGTITVTIASPAVVTLASHVLIHGSPVKFTNAGGALPTGIVSGTTYYAGWVSANTFNLYPTLADAMAKTNIVNTSGTQSGTHSMTTPATGANKVRVWGLDGTFTPITEVVSLTGQTIAVTTKKYLRVFGMEVTECGSGLVNAGIIYAVRTGTGVPYTTGTPGALTSGAALIVASGTGGGSTMNGMYTVPAGKTARLVGAMFACRAQACTFQITSQKLDGTALHPLVIDLPVEVNTTQAVFLGPSDLERFGLEWPEKTDIRARVLAAGASGIASVMLYFTLR